MKDTSSFHFSQLKLHSFILIHSLTHSLPPTSSSSHHYLPCRSQKDMTSNPTSKHLYLTPTYPPLPYPHHSTGETLTEHPTSPTPSTSTFPNTADHAGPTGRYRPWLTELKLPGMPKVMISIYPFNTFSIAEGMLLEVVMEGTIRGYIS